MCSGADQTQGKNALQIFHDTTPKARSKIDILRCARDVVELLHVPICLGDNQALDARDDPGGPMARRGHFFNQVHSCFNVLELSTSFFPLASEPRQLPDPAVHGRTQQLRRRLHIQTMPQVFYPYRPEPRNLQQPGDRWEYLRS